jgi:hypothetical protein
MTIMEVIGRKRTISTAGATETNTTIESRRLGFYVTAKTGNRNRFSRFAQSLAALSGNWA